VFFHFSLLLPVDPVIINIKENLCFSITREEERGLESKYLSFFKTAFFWGFILIFVAIGLAQEISSADEQDMVDAQNALESAQRAKAEKYSQENFKKAQDLLVVANEARRKGDAVKFSQAARLARAYAELAKAAADLKTEEEKLSLSQEELQNVKAEIGALKKGHAP
jgi:hypothetical protein